MAALNPRLADLSDDDRQMLESWLVEFDQGWDERLLASRLDEIPRDSSWRLPALAEMVKIDLERQWRHGRQVSLESYLEEFPELGSPGDVSVDLIQAEYEVRRQFGAPLTLEDYNRRFPNQAREFARLIAPGGPTLSRHSSVVAPSRSSAQAHQSEESPDRIPEQFGRYRIIKRLGQGGMGSVYLAQDTHLERPVALKVPDFGKHEVAEARRRFLEEARTAATLDHPYLCPVYDAGEIDGQPYLTMAYIEGQSLAASIGDAGWPQRQVAALVGKLALALQEAHTRKVIHRDLKPANVMIKTTGGRREPVIVDFGLARRDNPREQRLTRMGQIMGTLAYMAPEQIRGDLNQIGPACDIYALGVILYELLTGRLPFSGSGLAVAAQILTEAPLPLSTLRSDLDPALEAICLKAMARTVKDRYASMAELAAALTGFLHSSSASPTPLQSVGSPDSPSPTSGKRPQPAGTNSLVGQFLAQLAGTEESPSSVPTAEPLASLAPSLKRHPLFWPSVVAASVLSVVLLSVIIHVFTDKARVKITVDGPALASEADTKKASGLIPLEREKPATKERVAARNPSKKEKTAKRKKVAAHSSFENEKTADTGKVTESNPWPEARAEAGHLLPLWNRILTMSSDCRRLAVATQTDLKIVLAPDASKAFEMKGQPPSPGASAPYIWAAAFSPDDKYIAIAFNEFPARIWDIATGKNACQTSLSPGTALVYSSDGKRLAVAGRQHKVVSVGDSATGKKLFDLGPHSAVTDSVAFSPDGKWLASGSGAETGDEWGMKFGTGSDLKIWDLKTNQGYDLEGHPMRVNAVTFSPDGTRLASASSDKTVKVWDLAAKKCVATFNGHQTSVRFVRFSPDGRLIASAGAEKAVRVWDAATGRQAAILAGLRGNPEFVQFSAGGHWIYSGARSTLKAWECPTSPVPGGNVVLSTRADERPARAAVKQQPVQNLEKKGAESDRLSISETAQPENAPAKAEAIPTAGVATAKSAGLAKAKRKAPGNPPKLIAKSIGMTLRLIPAGEFMMGSPGDDKDVALHETPRRKVRISAFYLGVTEVTQAQYKELRGNNPSHFSSTGDGKDKVAGRSTGQYPVERVTWLDAVHFCNTLSEKEGRALFYAERDQKQDGANKGPGYRLPTEAEWEYACRAGTTTRYFFGDAGPTLREYAWFHGNAGAMTHPVGEKHANDFGLYDMHGNVREWCSDWFDDSYYQRRPAIDPQGPSVGVRHVIRGGNWNDRPPALRSAGRSHGAADLCRGGLGFRVALGQVGQ